MTSQNAALSKLINTLAEVPPSGRIEFREPILAHGEAAHAALVDLALLRDDLGPSVVAWLEVAAGRGPSQRASALAALRRLTRDAGSAAPYGAASLARLGAVDRPPASRGAPPSIPTSAGTEWPGFQKYEFGRNEGTAWRSRDGRTSLAPLLSRALRDLDPDFRSSGVGRSPEIHFALARRYAGQDHEGVTASKLFVYAHGPNSDYPTSPTHVAAGWYIERGEADGDLGPPDDPRKWDWPLFLGALSRERTQRDLTTVMTHHGLSFGDYAAGGRYTQTLGWVAKLEDGVPVARRGQRALARGWDELAASLAAAPKDKWVDLHLWRTWPADEAIAAGQPFAMRELMPVLVDLGRIYLDVIARR
jgi:hypothetical protein